MAGIDPLCQFAWYSLGGHLGSTGYFLGMAMRQFGGIEHIPQFSDISTVTCEYGLLDIDIVVVGSASKFWKAHRLSVDFPLYSRDGKEWFSTKFRVWRDKREPVFVLDLSSLDSTDLPFPADILRDYTLEFEIRVERTFVDVRECLREVVRDRDYCRKLVDTVMDDVKEKSSVQESELAALRAELD